VFENGTFDIHCTPRPLSADAVQHLLGKHLLGASKACPSIQKKRITFHCLRHTMAMDLLHAGVEQTAIALWLGTGSDTSRSRPLRCTSTRTSH
jgi:site-specific recombinase XerD